MKIAAIGCGHGQLDDIYAAVQTSERASGQTVDAVVICGDFEALRNSCDLEHMAVPPKYRHMGDFYKYYSEQKTAPYLTIVIGGNHESSAYMWELYHGGWLAPNIYFLGYAGAIRLGTLRIAGMSGIWNEKHYRLGHYENAPYNADSLRSAYHTRLHEAIQMTLLPEPVDLFISHDWPRHIMHYGDSQALLRIKPFFEKDFLNGQLGSPVYEHLLHHLRPTRWLAGHMHVRFTATVTHPTPRAPLPDVEQFRHVLPAPGSTLPHPGSSAAARVAAAAAAIAALPPLDHSPTTTEFTAIDKCVHNRQFLEIVDIPGHSTGPLYYDLEWLAIVKATHQDMSTARHPPHSPIAWRKLRDRVATARAALVADRFAGGTNDPGLAIPHNFERTALVYRSDLTPAAVRAGSGVVYRNPQTAAFAGMLAVPVVNDRGMAPVQDDGSYSWQAL
ncbi:lariat debranching enzyme, C-terminal domain-containing protein [Blastocladiella britannica]|nr:lariat debranching enzyme, C-terminal domain-containing protein [Blastocladiella britannica]